MGKQDRQLDWRKGFLLPVLVNVTTAGLVLLGALAFKEPLFRLFGASKEQEYPVYCVPEPVPNEGDPNLMDVELFIINRTVKHQNAPTLTAFLEVAASRRGVPTKSPDIVVRARNGVRITDVDDTKYAIFNQDKGKIEVVKPEEGEEWRIKVVEMAPSAILKVRVLTTRPLKGATRGQMARIGVVVEYAGLNPL